jgi:hypothetical protein
VAASGMKPLNGCSRSDPAGDARAGRFLARLAAPSPKLTFPRSLGADGGKRHASYSGFLAVTAAPSSAPCSSRLTIRSRNLGFAAIRGADTKAAQRGERTERWPRSTAKKPHVAMGLATTHAFHKGAYLVFLMISSFIPASKKALFAFSKSTQDGPPLLRFSRVQRRVPLARSAQAPPGANSDAHASCIRFFRAASSSAANAPSQPEATCRTANVSFDSPSQIST